MRQGQQQQKRMRGRNNNNRKGPNPLNRSYESNGPDVKVRGTASHIAEKYVQLARDAQSSGDPVAAENYLQHAEHYFRIVAANQPQFPQHRGGQPGFGRSDDDDMDDESGEQQTNGFDGHSQGGERQQQQQAYPQNAPQPPYQGEGQPQPREQREPREQRKPPEPREARPDNGGSESSLPAFITGGGEAPERAEGERPSRPRRNNRRFGGRYGRDGQSEAGGPEGSAPPSAEPEVAPGE